MKSILKNIWKFLNGKSTKIYIAKLLMIVSVYIPSIFYKHFSYATVGLAVLFILCEFSTSSILWLVITALNRAYLSDNQMMIVYTIFTIVLFIKFIFQLRKKEINYKSKYFLTICSLFLLFTIFVMFPFSKYYNFSNALRTEILILMLILLFSQRKNINIYNLFLSFFIYVILVSCFMLALQNYIEGATHYKCWFNNNLYVRLDAFLGNPNFGTAIMLVALSAWIVLYKKGLLKKYVYFFGLFAISSFIILTISKTGAIILTLLIIYVVTESIILTIKTKDKKHLYEILFYFVSILTACLVCFNHTGAILNRFFGNHQSSHYEPGLDTLTTGRVGLLKKYLKDIFSSPRTFLFGHCGVSIVHNVFIDYIYRVGLIPTIILGIMLVMSIDPFFKQIKPYGIIASLIVILTYCTIGSTSLKHLQLYIVGYLTIYFSAQPNNQKSS
ncbi:MAG: hypothetical protein E7374_02100 [Clostridiales bacterium]|nr:hypothetical protein [Clostridiales bacterium]